MEKRIGKIICSRARRIARGRSLPKNGTGPTHASKRRFPRPGPANTNSGRRSRGSTTFMAIEICSVPVRRSKNSKKPESFLRVAANRKRMLRRILILVAGATIVFLASTIYFCAHHVWNPLPAGTTIDFILVEKSVRKLSIFRDGRKLKSYRAALGHNPIGPKEQEGDMKTPEGIYTIDWRNPESDYHLSLHVFY